MGLVIPARIKGQDVAFEHSLEEAYCVAGVPKYQPVLGGVSADDFEPEVFVEYF